MEHILTISPGRSGVAGVIVAVLDACVLFPRVLRDTLLDAALARLYVPRWTAEILDELGRNLIRHRGLEEERAARLIAAARQVFPGAEVTGHEALIPLMTNHPKDRHVLAAAVHSRADFIVTSNLVDFGEEALHPYEVAAASPDAFLSLLCDIAPGEMVRVIVEQAGAYRRPAMTVDDLLGRLAVHAPSFPTRMARELS